MQVNGAVSTFPNKSPFSIFGLLLVIVSARLNKAIFIPLWKGAILKEHMPIMDVIIAMLLFH